VKNLWKVFGPIEHKLIGTPDADLSTAGYSRRVVPRPLSVHRSTTKTAS
jgi:hypothetical protein